MKRAAGFTLLELLVAMTLLALLSVVLMAGLRFGANIWRKSESKNIDANTIRTAQRTLAGALDRVYPKYVVSDPTHEFVVFDGTSKRLSFLSTAAPSGHIARDTLEVIGTGPDAALRLSSAPELGGASSATTLLTRLSSAEFSYFGLLGGERAPSWHAVWRNQRALPSLIRVRASVADAGAVAWPEMILAPKIAADIGCIYDAVTKFCRGRS